MRAATARVRFGDRGWGFFGARRPGARLVLWASLMGGVGIGVSGLLLNFYLEALGLSAAAVGLVNAAPAAAAVAAALPAGLLGDRFGRRPALIFAGLLAWGGAAAFALAPAVSTGETPVWLVLAGLAQGFAGAVLSANVMPYLAEESTGADRPRLFAAQAALLTVAGVAGNALGGLLPGWFARRMGGSPHDLAALRASFVTVVAIQAAAVVPVAAFFARGWVLGGAGDAPPAGAVSHAPSDTDPSGATASGSDGIDSPAPAAEQPGTAVPARAWLRLLLPVALVGLGAGQLVPFLNLFLAVRFRLPLDRLGSTFAWSALVTAAATLAQPRVAARLGQVGATVLTQGLSVPFLLLLGFSPTLPVALVAFYARGALMNMAHPVWAAYALQQVPAARRSLFSSAQGAVWNGLWAAGAYWSGWLRERVGFEGGFVTLFLTAAALYLAAIVLTAVWFGRDPTPAARSALRR